MARLKKRKDGRYQRLIGVVDENGKPVLDEDGKRKRKPVYGKTLKELNENADKAVEEMKAKTIASTMKMSELCSLWLDSKSSKAYNTWHSYESTLNAHIIPALGGLCVSQVTVDDIEKLINPIIAKGQNRTALKVFTALRQIFKRALIKDIILVSPMLHVEKPVYMKPKRRALKQKELEAIREADFTLKEKAFVSILHRTGIRIGELLALHVSDLDFDTDTFTVNKDIYYVGNSPHVKNMPKTEAGVRTIPIADDLKAVLSEYIPTLADGSDILFPYQGSYMTFSVLRRFWAKIIGKIKSKGVEANEITAHMFRHNWLTELMRKGADIKTIQKLAGHSKSEVLLDIYLHEVEDTVETARKLLNS